MDFLVTLARTGKIDLSFMICEHELIIDLDLL